LGEGSLKILTKLMNTIYETGEWPKDFTEATMMMNDDDSQVSFRGIECEYINWTE
jgi:hypothetical protein